MAKIKKIVQFFFVWADFGFYQPQIKLNINFFDFFFTLSLQSKKFILSFKRNIFPSFLLLSHRLP